MLLDKSDLDNSLTLNEVELNLCTKCGQTTSIEGECALYRMIAKEKPNLRSVMRR